MPNEEALLQLHRVVAAAPDDLLHMRRCVEEAACGTARCALGWAIIDPWFREHTTLSKEMGPDWSYGGFSNNAAMEIGRAIFGIDRYDFENLFATKLIVAAPPHAVSKAEVLDNINRLLRGEPAEPYEAVMRYNSSFDYEEDDEDDD